MKFIGGALCLDFVNTVGAWVSTHQGRRRRNYADTVLRDKIGSYQDLLAWAHEGGVLSREDVRRIGALAEREPQPAAGVLRRAMTLRASLYRILRCAIEHWTPDESDVTVLEKEIAFLRTNERLRHSGSQWRWELAPVSLECVVWLVARSAAELLTSPELANLRQCPGHECGWLFLDTSQNRRRQWCEMKVCGNRAKVKRFRERATRAVIT